jgi:phosphoribosylaminoimidazolecarboxamide formyltransferase/IMP cyclohydrolase
VLEELKERGKLSIETRRRLAAKAFRAHGPLRRGDRVGFPSESPGQGISGGNRPGFEKRQDLRYGENPHQKAAFYQESGTRAWGVVGAKVLQGKQVSFNNYMDCDAAWRLVSSFTNPAAVVIKHNNPCGVAEGEGLADAFRQAYAADSLSAFGGMVGFNRSVDGETAQEMSKLFLECVIAPGFTRKLGKYSAKKPTCVCWNSRRSWPTPTNGTSAASLGGFLVQEQDSPRPLEMKVVSRRAPSPEEQMSLAFRLAGGQTREIERHRFRPGPRDGRASARGKCPASIP